MAALTQITSAIVRSTLGVAYNSWSLLIKSSAINQWSKYKPVVGPRPAGTTGFYGLGLPLWNNTTKTFSPTNWNYIQPRGGGAYAEPLRAGDFRGYEHNSALTYPPGYCITGEQDENTPLSPAQPSGGQSSNTAKARFCISSSVRPTITEMGLGDYYFGVMVKTPGNHYYIQTKNTHLNDVAEATGVSIILQADVVNRTDPDADYTNLPAGVGSFVSYYVICNTERSAAGVWTEVTNEIIYLLPSGSVSGMTFKNSFTFTVEDWVYAANGSMSFAYDDDTAAEYQSSRIYMSNEAEPFTVDISEATWLEFEVYASDNTTKITNPALWGNGCYLRLFPINANGGAAKNGTVYVDGTNCTAYPISVTHQASPATVNVYAGNVAVLTVSATGGNVSGNLNVEFTPHYVPGGDPTYTVGWQIAVNEVRVYSSYGIATLSCTDDIHKNLTPIAHGSPDPWEDGDAIDVFIYYNQAPPLA